MVNVRFYRLETLPSFVLEKHNGIFVHVTGTMHDTPWDLSDKEKPIRINPKELLITTPDIFLDKWLSNRHITKIASGLWFGGENGWELLSNETNSAAINAAIEAKIATLNVNGYAQATISGSTLTISGIKENNGIIAKDDSNELVVAIDGTYDNSTNKIATQSTVTNAIEALDANTVQAVTFNTSNVDGNTTLTFKGIKEVDGRIAQGDEQTPDTFIVGDAKLNIEIGSDSFEVFSANTKENKSIYLNENVFKKDVVDGKNVLSVITKTAVASNNKLVTEQDIANLGGAMHYKGPLTGDGSWPTTVAAGDVYIVTTGFTHSNESNPFEVGDMIVFNSTSASDYKVIQSNLTLGTGDGQVAANVGALADGKLVVGVNPATGSKGIKTVEFDVTNLTDTTGKNERKLTLTSQRADQELQSEGAEGVQGLYHSVGITDTFTIMGRNMSKSFSISSPNRSISIEKVGGENSTDAQIDLIWNTVMDA